MLSSSSILSAITTANFDDNNEVNLGIAQEDLVDEMRAHCNAFRNQRKLVQTRAKEAKEDLAQNLQWPNILICLVGDYSQNLDLPHFGGEQPGDTYYYSPLNVAIFGLVNYATEVLYVYSYPEG